MKQEKIIRPDAGTAKAMIDVAMRIDTKLKEVLDSEDLQRRAAQEAARKILDIVKHMRHHSCVEDIRGYDI